MIDRAMSPCSVWRTLHLLLLALSGVSAPPVATFDGKSYITMYVRNHASFGEIELIQMRIKTRSSKAFLFSTGIPSGNGYKAQVILYLMSGCLHMQLRVDDILHPKKRMFETLNGIKGRLNDNKWHSINLTWKNPNTEDPNRHYFLVIQLTLDGTQVHKDRVATSVKLSTKRLYLGGAPLAEINRLRRELNIPQTLVNFTGCMENAEYQNNNIGLVLINKTPKFGLIETHGEIKFDTCYDHFIEDPVSFMRPGASLKIPEGWLSPKEGNLSIRFRTTEDDGLILYQRGNGTDFLALELRSGDLFLLIDAGAGTEHFNVIQEVKKGPPSCSDGMLHTFTLNFSNRSVEFSLDGYSTKSNYRVSKLLSKNRPTFKEINLRPEIYLGSLPSEDASKSRDIIIPRREVWSAVVRQGFVGCLSALSIDDRIADLVYYAQLQRPRYISTNTSLCMTPSKLQCQTRSPSQYCKNGGICRVGWNRLICDCSMTNYTGETCEESAKVLSFDGTQWMKIRLPGDERSETEQLQLRFKTTRKNGLLFTSRRSLSSDHDRFELKIEDGYLIVIFNFGSKNNRMKINRPIVSDGRWHLVKIRRRALIVEITIDEQSLDKKTIYDLDATSGKLLDINTIEIGNKKFRGRQKKDAFFVGHMMHFIFNGVNYLQKAHKDSPASIEVNAVFSEATDAIRELPVTFKTAQSYLTVSTLKIYNGFSIEFEFKTTQSHGVILYNDNMHNGKRKDFILIELVSGNLNLCFDIGTGRSRIMSSKSRLNDGKWHRVRISREEDVLDTLHFRVDEKEDTGKMIKRIKLKNKEMKSINFNLRSPLYIGGVPSDWYTTEKCIISKMGFQGCLASLSLNRPNGKITNVFTDSIIPKEYTNDIVRGCASSGARCTPKSCHYGGHCVQQWTRTRCDCGMTSFVGEYCSDVASTIQFGIKRGLVAVEYDSKQLRNTLRDEIAFGIQTTKTDVTLLNILGGGSFKHGFDYIVMDILKQGFLQAEYFTGSHVQKVTDTNIYVADGSYHIVRFVRDGADAMLNIDNSKVRKRNTRKSKTLHFNQQRWIYLGGPNPRFRKFKRGRRPQVTLRHVRRSIFRPRGSFRGIISGFVFNRLPVTDLVADRTTRPNIRVSRFGNVTILDNFKPKLSNFPPPDPVRVYPQIPGESHNAMLSTTSELSPSITDAKSEGLVKAKLKCPDPKAYRTNPNCISNNDPNSLVQASVVVTLPTTTTAPPTRTSRIIDTGIVLNAGKTTRPASRDDTKNWKGSGRGRDPLGSQEYDTSRSSDQPASSNDGRGTTNRGDPNDLNEASLNLWLIVAISCGGLVFLVLIICLIYRCRRRDEGSYSVESNQRDFGGDPACKPLRDSTSFMNGTVTGDTSGDGVIVGVGMTATPLNNRNGAGSAALFGSGSGSGKRKKGRRKETKEWYV